MRFMNTFDIDESLNRYRNDAVLGPATRTLANLRDAADNNSDGWAYWPKPARAAAKLMELIERGHATPTELRAALKPVKAFRTTSKIDFVIEEGMLMNFATFSQLVNELAYSHCEKLNTENPQALFRAKHVGYPDSMLRYYYDSGMTPSQALAEILQTA